MTPRTSLTHPLRIDGLSCAPFASGTIGITFCPGKWGDSVYGAPWQRDLDVDLDAIRAWGVSVAMTLIRQSPSPSSGTRSIANSCPGESLLTMRNGYALCTEEGLARIDALLERSEPRDVDSLRGLLRIGLHWNVEVTDAAAGAQIRLPSVLLCPPRGLHARQKRERWQRSASLVLEATYEATLLSAVLNFQHGGTNEVLLTRVEGGAFGNDFAWINRAIERAVTIVENAGLDVRIVSFNLIPADIRRLCRE